MTNSNFPSRPPWHDPYEFSQQVYLIMASMNQIGHPNNDSVSKYMQDIVGANMGFIFTNPAKKSFDAKMVTSMIRDMIKSVLRGVSDFTKYPDMIENDKHVVWYPDPSLKRGKQDFNVFNLDPFVWFVHVKLGFSGYGFSVDDDTADVGAGGASQLQLTVTETGGLNNTNPWTIQAPYGPVKNVSLSVFGPGEFDPRGYPLQRHPTRQQYHTDQDHHGGSTQPLPTERQCGSTRSAATLPPMAPSRSAMSRGWRSTCSMPPRARFRFHRAAPTPAGAGGAIRSIPTSTPEPT